MFESQRQCFEYQLCILSVKMKVKFPCRMKIEHLGSLITGQSPPSDDNRFIFNQEVILKDQTQSDCFQLTINLLTDKGAKYNGGAIKLYKSELVRSEGERLVLSLSKCIDSQAFCEVKVDRVIGTKTNKNVPFDKKSILKREVTYRMDTQEFDHSPYRNNPIKILQSKSEYQFPLHHNTNGHKNPNWQTKSKSRIQPQPVYSKSKPPQRVNYAVHQSTPYNQFQLGNSNVLDRQKALEAEVYKEGYQKLKEKYKKQAENSKQELNKRLALENTQNNLKLEIMRLKLKLEEQDKSITDKNNKLKEQQNKINNLQEKQMQNAYMREEMNKKQNIIKTLQDKIRNLTRNIEQLRDMSADRTLEQTARIRQLHLQMQTFKNKSQAKQRQLQKQIKNKIQAIHFKDLQLLSLKDNLQRQKKNNSDLQKTLQSKHFEIQKLIHNQKNINRNKIDQYKSKTQKLQASLLHKEQQLKNQLYSNEQFKSHLVKLQYDHKITSQELQSLRLQYNQYKVYKQKYSETVRENKSLVQQNLQLQRQLQRAIQNKEYNITQINKQYQDQVEYYKRINRQLDEKNKNTSNKLIQIEGQLQLSRNQQDKLRRNLQSTVKEAAQAKQKQKTAKKILKTKEQQSLSLQTEHATLKQKLKSIQQIYKLQVDKVRDQVEKMEVQLQNYQEKVEQLTQSNNQLNMELNRIKIKLQYSQEKNQKDTANLKEKQTHVQHIIKDYEEQLSTLDKEIHNLRITQKEQSNKIQQKEIQIIKNQEKYEKAKKDIKVLEEKLNQLNNTLKLKISQIEAIITERDAITKRLSQSEIECNGVKADIVNLANERSKLSKINDLSQQQIKKLKNDLLSANSMISQKQKQYEQLGGELKLQRQQYSKLDIKYSTYKKQVDRYKESLNDTIHKYIVSLHLKEDTKKTFQQLFINKSSEYHFNDIINLIITQSKQVKQIITKQSEQLKQLQRQNERANEQASHSSSKYQTVESTLRRQLQELESEYSQYHQQKEAECINYNHTINQLEQRGKSLQAMQEQLNTQIQQLNFTINSMKMNSEAINDQQSKKIINFKKLTAEQQEKIQYQLITITELDQRCSALENQIDTLQSQIQNQVEASHKKDKLIEECKQLSQTQERTIEQLKKQKKQLTEKVSELQLHLNTERQLKEKNRILLEQQQSKGSELKNFISNLMKQKQSAIKSELERSEKLMEIQSAYLELNKELQLLKEQNDRNCKALEQQKQQNKKHLQALRQLQTDRKQQRSKHTKTQEKLRQKEKQLISKDQNFKKNQVKYQKALQRYKLEIKELQQQLQLRNSHSLSSNKDNTSKIISLQAQLQDKNSQIAILLAKAIEHEEEIYSQREKNMQTNQQFVKIKSQYQQLKLKISKGNAQLSQVTNQSKQKEQKLFQLSGKIFILQGKLQSKQSQLHKRLDELNQQWINKYESMCEEYQQRMELIEKERDYFRNQSQEKDRDISKLTHALKNAQSTQASQRRTLEDKIRKLEEEKLALFTVKNNQIQRLVEEGKLLTDTNKQRETQLRRLTNELQVARKTITNLDTKSKEYDQKIKGINKVYQTQLQQLKKKDVTHKAYRQSVNNYHWGIQREIKKNIQNFIKTFLQFTEDKNSTKLVELIRALEKAIIDTISQKPAEK